MPNASHILETALLLLAAFLLGCVAGYLLRRLAAGRSRPALAEAARDAPAAAAFGTPLVVAPRIDPIAAVASKPLPAQGAETAVSPPAAGPLPVADAETMRPARVAGEATSGRLIAGPAAPPAEREHVAAEPAPAPIEISWSELSGRPGAPRPALREEDTEGDAMRAVEGGWSPRPAPPSVVSRRVELLEPIDVGQPAEAAAAAAGDAASVEIADAISAARSGVAAASAAAATAIAAHSATPDAAAAGSVAAGQKSASAGGRTPFGRPNGLAAPRGGRKDELRQIKTISSQIEAALNELGIFHFDQIAAWDKKAIVWMDHHFALRGRLVREKWIEQARELATGRALVSRPAKR